MSGEGGILSEVERSPDEQMAEGQFEVRAPNPRVLLTVISGRIDKERAEAAHDRFSSLIGHLDRPIWVSDATRLTWFEPRSLALGPRWFAAFRERGGRHCFVVSKWEVAMMAARTMALGFGVCISHFATLEEAMARAEFLLSNP